MVRNNGPDVATNVTFRGLDLIVNTHTIDSVSASQGSCLPPPYNYSPITCQIGTLAPGASATVTVIARPTVGVFQYDFQQEIIVDALADATVRDGVKLHTVIMVPKGARRAPIVLTRTPYNASKRAERAVSNSLAGSLPASDDQLAADGGYIRVYQDVRGKYGWRRATT